VFGLDEDNTKVVEKKAEEKKVEDKKAVKAGGEEKGIGAWFAGIRGEFKKIFWPSKKELVNNSITVVITSAIIAVIVYVMDLTFMTGYAELLNFTQNFRL
jgi:preprotein translocase subunit SecE